MLPTQIHKGYSLPRRLHQNKEKTLTLWLDNTGSCIGGPSPPMQEPVLSSQGKCFPGVFSLFLMQLPWQWITFVNPVRQHRSYITVMPRLFIVMFGFLCNCYAHLFHHIYSHLLNIYFSPPIIGKGMMGNNWARASQEKPKYGSASTAAGALGRARSPRHEILRATGRRYVIVVHIHFIIYNLT